MLIADIIKGYINRRTDKILEELITVVSDLTNSIVDMNERQIALEKAINIKQPKYIVKNGRIEMD